MTTVPKSADYLRLFQRAIRDGVSMEEARRRIAAERWRVTDAQLARRRAATPISETEGARPEQPWMMRD
ncbi:hypothetical protein [Sphingomonas sp. TX0522]|uniref:hypothetical protein n=1 Tax=Sphingomonas sp. TX0522 TaxID=2479205 RepID=UPI0018DFA03F|nr:hypothetical protein [Sphingomonas sp. TX0522]MBI0530065.1 hypothetical protein [Sphingomonas sp. TX0522]